MRTLRWFEGALIFGISYLASAAVVLPLAAVLPLREVTAISIVVLVVISYLWLRAVTGDPARYVGLAPVSANIILLTVLASAAVMVPAVSLEAVVLKHFEAPPEVVHALEDLVRARSPLGLLYVILVAAVGASLSEEFVFRGILQNSLAEKVGGWAALIIATVVFGLLHTLWRFPGAFVLGMFLGFLYLRTGSLIPGLVSHAVINTTSVVLFNAAEWSTSAFVPAWLEEEKPAPLWLLGLAVAVLVFTILALWRATRDEYYPLPHGKVGGEPSQEGRAG